MGISAKPSSMKPDRFGAALLTTLGFFTIGTGVYFLFFRPAMLPEDILFTSVPLERLPPQMSEWLQIVFRTWGGFMVGFGFLLMAVASYLLTGRVSILRRGVALAILIAFSRFLASNLSLHSDYLWFVWLLSAIAAVTILCLARNAQSS
jgi:hypothetical protein